MATIRQILRHKFPGSEDGRVRYGTKEGGDDDFRILDWKGTDPKPTEAQLRAFSAEVDQLVYDEFLDLEQERRGFDVRQIMRALNVLVENVQELHASLPDTRKAAYDAGKLDRLTKLDQRLRAIKQDAKARLDAFLAAGGKLP